MTEDEARKSKCCSDISEPCVASRCMGWRWSRAKETKAFLDDVQAHMIAENVNFQKATEAVWKAKGGTYERTEGYCGLAG